jgi:predicted O-methyltransferase YrrM
MMQRFKSLAYHLFNPKLAINKIKFFLLKSKFNKKEIENKQNLIFNKLFLNRISGLKKLKILKNNNNLFYRDMSSEHEVLFSSLSIKNKKIKKILEIGTFDGINALFLSEVFKKAKINTIDLPKNSEEFINSYNRSGTISKFIKKRTKILSRSNNINFYEMNSLQLLYHKTKYDLIWVDGAHGYPVACIDIINSLRLINNNGLIVCDDVFIRLAKSDTMYNSIATYQTLESLRKAKMIKYTLIHKRIAAEDILNKINNKYIAVIQKI